MGKTSGNAVFSFTETTNAIRRPLMLNSKKNETTVYGERQPRSTGLRELKDWHEAIGSIRGREACVWYFCAKHVLSLARVWSSSPLYLEVTLFCFRSRTYCWILIAAFSSFSWTICLHQTWKNAFRFFMPRSTAKCVTCERRSRRKSSPLPRG